ncbi:MAG: SemiSWEET transporter [Nanoarchaeota archaeon]|nr:SemiSWEET transporter [Nanoarchaeota archaeon]
MEIITLIGMLAGLLTTGALIPQVLQTWREKKTKDISLWMYILFFIGVLLWLIYGIFLANLPIIIANAVTLVLASVILYFKISYG